MNTEMLTQDETQQSSYYFTETTSGGKIFLVVEDDFTYQPLWEKIIRTVDPKAKIRWCITAEGAEELIKKSDTFDFIIADILLSGPKTAPSFVPYFGDDIHFLNRRTAYKPINDRGGLALSLLQ